MFGMFKKEKKMKILSPVSGTLIPMAEVKDDMFSQKILGDGFAVIPEDNEIKSPVGGRVESVFPTKHAITLQSAEGVSVLIHLGIDTVELDGTPFDIKVKEGDGVEAGESLGSMNRQQIYDSGKDNVVIVVFTDKEKVAEVPNVASHEVLNGDDIGDLVLK